jgi:hypothetical protein
MPRRRRRGIVDRMTTHTSSTTDRPQSPARIAWWPTAIGIVSGVAIVFSGNVPAVVMVCAAIYLLAAATERPWAAWLGFAASLPLIGIGRVLDAPWLSLALIGLGSVVLVVVGAIRGAWKRPANARQLGAIVVFSAAALVAAIASEPLAVAVAVAGLLAHAAWDIWHHVRGAVVARPYAEFCAALDIVLAIAVVVTLFVSGAS